MKHGIAFRKFSRTSSHRMLMLRNLVTSLIKHEQIKTTLPKAKDTARLVEKIITMGKKGDLPAYQRANAFLLEPKLTPKVFTQLAKRYSDREGGYTRIHKFGNRPGDNAPHAVLELVDNPRDIKFEMTARSVGWELLSKRIASTGPQTLVNSGISDVKDVIERGKTLPAQEKGELRGKTRWSLQKILRFRDADAVAELQKKAEDHIDNLLAKPLALKTIVDAEASKNTEAYTVGSKALRLKAGQTLPGGTRSTLHLAQGALGKEAPSRPRWFERRKLGIDYSASWKQL